MDEKQWLNNSKMGLDIYNKKYRFNNESFDAFLDRVSGGNESLKSLILQRKFLFGGRTLSNRDTGRKASYFNCYASGEVKDNLKDIMKVNTKLALTFKAQGGQGICLSKLRPKGTQTSSGYTSDGIIPFMAMYNQTTATISQGGARKGALMISLDGWHKEALDFITIKSNDTSITKANLSLELDDEFMECVKSKRVQTITRTYGKHTITYDVDAYAVFRKLCENAHEWGDPACLYKDMFRNYNLMQYDNDYNIEAPNPCGEQPLPPDFACNLASINTSEYIIDPFTPYAHFDTESFIQDIYIAVRALDDIIDENANNHAIKAHRRNSLNYRNIGLGVMGYANTLMKLGLTYGSTKALSFTDDLFKLMFHTALRASIKLAEERGMFPKCKRTLIANADILHCVPQDIIEGVKQHGLRNCSLLSIAPTGSLSSMLGISGGCEPEYAIQYTRYAEGMNGEYYTVKCNTLQEYQAYHETEDVPDYFISSADIKPFNRIRTQAIMQKYIDTAISSTVNLPNSATVEDIEKIFIQGYEQGLKGITVFRDGCNRTGVLTTEKPTVSVYDTIMPTSRKTYGTTSGNTYCKKSACGTLYITLNKNSDGEFIESFIETSKGGICKASCNAYNRLASLALRSGVKVDEVVDQLKGITCPACTKTGCTDGLSCPDILARTIGEFLKETPSTPQYREVMVQATPYTPNVENCPQCGNGVIYTNGCSSCLECGFSKCS